MWGQAPDGLQVGLYRIDGAGHAEPSRLKRYPRFINWLTGLQNADLEVAEAAWDFFREKRARPHAGGRNCRTSNSMCAMIPIQQGIGFNTELAPKIKQSVVDRFLDTL
jgi:hypothetical protein